MVGSSFFMPSGAPGRPTLVRPVRIGDCPVMKAARPAVQLCWPYQSVNSAPSLRDAVDVRRLVAHHAHVVGADVELADVVAPDDQDVGRLLRLGQAAQAEQAHEQCEQPCPAAWFGSEIGRHDWSASVAVCRRRRFRAAQARGPEDGAIAAAAHREPGQCVLPLGAISAPGRRLRARRAGRRAAPVPAANPHPSSPSPRRGRPSRCAR